MSTEQRNNTITPDALKTDDRIIHKGTCHTVTSIKSWHDNAHGRVYALDLQTGGKQVRISVVEGAELEGC